MVDPATTGGGARSSPTATHYSMRRSNSAHNIAKQGSQRLNQHDLRQNMKHATVEPQLWVQESRQQSGNGPDPLPTPGRHSSTEPSELGIPEDEAGTPDEELISQSQQLRGRGRLSQLREQSSVSSAIPFHNQPGSRSKAQPQDSDHSIIEFSRPRRAFTFNSDTSAISNDSSMPHDSRWSSNTTIPAVGPSSRASTFQTDIPPGESSVRNSLQSVGLRQFLFKKEGRPTPRAHRARSLTPEHYEAGPVSATPVNAARPDSQKHPDQPQESKAVPSPEHPESALPVASPPSDECHELEVANEDCVALYKGTTSVTSHSTEAAQVMPPPDEHMKSTEVSDHSKIPEVRSENMRVPSPPCQASPKRHPKIGRLIRGLERIRLISGFRYIISAARGKEAPAGGASGDKNQKTASTGNKASNKRLLTRDDRRPADEDDEGDGSKRHRPNSGSKASDPTTCFSYKCLYYAYDPIKFSACGKYNSFGTISRLKQHIRRCHTYHCSYCGEPVDEDNPKKPRHEQERALHVAENARCGPNLPSPSEEWEDMSDLQKARLRKKDTDNSSSWQALFKFFFSTKTNEVPSSAYFEGPMSVLIQREVPIIINTMLETLPEEARHCAVRIEQWLQSTFPAVLHQLSRMVQLNDGSSGSSGQYGSRPAFIQNYQGMATSDLPAHFVETPLIDINQQQFQVATALPADLSNIINSQPRQTLPNYDIVTHPQFLSPGQLGFGQGSSGRSLDDPASSAASIRSGSSAQSSVPLKTSQVPSVAYTDPTEYALSQPFNSAPDPSNYQYFQSQHPEPASFTIPPPGGSSYAWDTQGTSVEQSSQSLDFDQQVINHMHFGHGLQDGVLKAPEPPPQPPYNDPRLRGYPLH